MKKPTRIILVVVIALLIGGAIAIDGSEAFLSRAVALNSVFTGLLTLTGFLFTARTFITFKLNEVVYGHPEYRSRVAELQADGAYNQKLYDPLREIDTRVGKACVWVFVTMLCVLTFSIFPKEWSKLSTSLVDHWKGANPAGSGMPWRFVVFQVATFAVFSVIFSVATEVLATILSVNQNIRAIINEWEERYNREKGKKGGAGGAT
jgi:hypothetical protein